MFADIGGIRMCYEDVGSGDTVVLIGGFGADRLFWRPLADSLDGFRVVTMDNRGVGDTKYGGGFTVQDMADDVVALMDALGIERAHVIGWSMGSQIAQLVASGHGGKVTSLTLMSSYTKLPSRSMYVLSALTSMAAGGVSSVDCLAVAVNAMCLTERAFKDAESERMSVPIPDDPQDPAGLMDQIDAMRGCDTASAAERIRVPTLVIHGTEDVMVDPSNGTALAGMIEDSELLLVEGEGHTIPACRYIEKLKEFLGSVR